MLQLYIIWTFKMDLIRQIYKIYKMDLKWTFKMDLNLKIQSFIFKKLKYSKRV